MVVNLKGILKMEHKDRNTAISIQSWSARHPLPVVMLVCLIPGMAASFLPTSPHQTLLGWGMTAAAGAICLLWGGLSLCRRLPEWGLGVCWWGIGYCLRFGAILRLSCQQMQHDVLAFPGEKGHAGYILYLYNNGHLPDFDVRDVWQFYHPPLHHLLCAGCMQVGNALHLEGEALYESLQVLPFTYSCCALTVFGLLLREFRISGRAFVIPFAIVALHPSQIILSGSLNNDMLSILFMELSLLLMIRWFRVPKIGTILLLALTIGLGMLTKLSAWMAAPAAAVLFLWKLLQTAEKQERLHLTGEFVWFGVVCVPIGLFWSVRNLVKWGVPPAYIPMLSEDSGQYVGNHPIWERLFSLAPHQFSYIYDCYTIYGQDYSEYNPIIGLLKTAVFDEFVNTDRFPAAAGFGELLFWSQVLLVFLTLAAMLRVLRRHGSQADLTALAVTYGIVLFCYLLFCLNYPHTCTQSFRYAVPTLYTSLVFLGLFLQEKPLSGLGRAAVSLLTGCFLGTSALVYGVLLFV